MPKKKQAIVFLAWVAGSIWLISAIIELINWDDWSTDGFSAIIENIFMIELSKLVMSLNPPPLNQIPNIPSPYPTLPLPEKISNLVI